MPSAQGISHLHPLGWHQGGHNEAEQASLLTRLAQSVKEAGAAGGLAFTLHDEWYKHNWLVRRFEEPEERTTLWLNDLSPDQRYGLIGFHTSKWKLFTGDESAWRAEPTLHTNARAAAASGSFDGALSLRSLQAAADEGYLYLRLVVGCLDCVPAERAGDGRPRFDKASYAISLNTLPGASGIQTLPFGSVTLSGAANFLLLLTDPSAARLLVADNYNPYETVATPGVAGETDLRIRRTLDLSMKPRGLFEEVFVEPNVRRFTREGRCCPLSAPIGVRCATDSTTPRGPTPTRLASGTRIFRQARFSSAFRGTSCLSPIRRVSRCSAALRKAAPGNADPGDRDRGILARPHGRSGGRTSELESVAGPAGTERVPGPVDPALHLAEVGSRQGRTVSEEGLYGAAAALCRARGQPATESVYAAADDVSGAVSLD